MLQSGDVDKNPATDVMSIALCIGCVVRRFELNGVEHGIVFIRVLELCRRSNGSERRLGHYPISQCVYKSYIPFRVADVSASHH